MAILVVLYDILMMFNTKSKIKFLDNKIFVITVMNISSYFKGATLKVAPYYFFFDRYSFIAAKIVNAILF